VVIILMSRIGKDTKTGWRLNVCMVQYGIGESNVCESALESQRMFLELILHTEFESIQHMHWSNLLFYR